MAWLFPILTIALAALLIDVTLRYRQARRRSIGLEHKNREAFEELCHAEDQLRAAKAREAEIMDAKDAHAALCAERDNYERRFWEIHDVVERVLSERDSWKQCFRTQVAEHLEGQAMLEQKMVQLRVYLYRALATVHRLQRQIDPKAELIKSPAALDPLDGPPVGQAERYFERMKSMLKVEAPASFDALMERDRVATAMRQREYGINVMERDRVRPGAPPLALTEPDGERMLLPIDSIRGAPRCGASLTRPNGTTFHCDLDAGHADRHASVRVVEGSPPLRLMWGSSAPPGARREGDAHAAD